MTPTPVISGVGVVSPYGVGWDTYRDGLLSGRSCVAPIRSFDASTFPTCVAAEVPFASLDADWLRSHLPASEQNEERCRRWQASGVLRDRRFSLALVAAAKAWEHAGCSEGDRGAALSIALGLERALLGDLYAILDGEELAWSRAPERSLPPTCLRTSVDLPTRAVRELLGLTGHDYTHVSACAAGTFSVAHAASLIRRGAADIVVTGGSDSMVNPLGVGGMSRLGAPSPRAAPDACRPFHRRRDGLAMGEGAAMFIVEREDRALARGVRPLARLLGAGRTQDGHAATAPWPDGRRAARAMQLALDDARLAPEAVGYLNAHGTGTPLNDPAETAAIRTVFQGAIDQVAVSSVKGAIGHWMAASGAAEVAATLVAFAENQLPPTAHLDEVDPACELDHVALTSRPAEVEFAMSNSFGFGGQNGSVVLGRMP